MRGGVSWNLWHGCHKISEGCRNCYVYRGDSKRGIDSTLVRKTTRFNVPVGRNKKGEYKIPAGKTVYTCFSSDFFVPDADQWRPEAWAMINERSDLHFFMITKRIDRFRECIPEDWGEGYENVTICCTVENQKMADYRLPIYMEAPIKNKMIVCEPLLSSIDLRPYLNDEIKEVLVGGESGYHARACNYEWVLDIREACIEYNVRFTFRQTGSKLLKDGKIYHIQRRLQSAQARKAGISTR